MKRLLICSCVFALASTARAEDVTQFRGAGGLGVSTATGLPVVWSEKNNIRWRAALPGRGIGNPVITGGRVFVTASSGWQQDRLHILCYDQASGKKLWERQFWATGSTVCHNKTCMAASTPVTDGQRVYALFSTCDLFCLDRDGRLVWCRSLVGDYPTVGNNVGMASSPVLCNDLLIVCTENAGESFAVGIDKLTGENRWRIPRPREINWVTPAVVSNHGQAEILFASKQGLTAVDAATGKTRWEITDKPFPTIPSPVFADGLVFAPGGKFLALRPGNPQKKPEIVWQSNKLPSGYASPVIYKGKVIMLSGRGVVNCVDIVSGAFLWDQRVEGSFAASPLVAEDRLYAVNEEGTTTVLDLNQTPPRILAVNNLPEKILASPVASKSCLYLRSDRFLYSIGTNKDR